MNAISVIDTIKVGSYIGKWKVKRIGIGGRSCRIFYVCDESLPEVEHVLKIIRDDNPDLAADSNSKEADRLREGMKKCPSRLPRLIATGDWHGLDFFVMEKLECIDYPIPVRDYLGFCVEAFAALGDLHDLFIHGDPTPLHLAWKDGRIAFIDLGSSMTPKEALENVYKIGTDPYVAPEVASQGKVSRQSDIWSLATILYERCPEELRECIYPILVQCLIPIDAGRLDSAREISNRLRKCRPPHHRFKATVKWTAIAGVGMVGIMAAIHLNTLSAARERHRRQIEIDSAYRTAIRCHEQNDHTNAAAYLRFVAKQKCAKGQQARRLLTQWHDEHAVNYRSLPASSSGMSSSSKHPHLQSQHSPSHEQ